MSYLGLPFIANCKYYIYRDTYDGNKFKARNGDTGKVEFVSANDDAQPTIQEAINAATNEPGVIELADNTNFPVVTTISGSPNRCFNLRSGIWLKGGGWNTKVILPGGIVGFRGADVSDVRISNLTIDGNNTDGSNGQGQQGGNIVLTGSTGSSRCVVDFVKSINSPEVGIKASRVAYFYAIGNYVDVTQLHSGIGYAGIQSVQGSKASVMIGNHVINPGGPSLGCNGQGAGNSKVIIMGNTCEVTSDSPLTEERGRGQIHIEGDSGAGNIDKSIIICNNVINNSYYGVHVLNGHRIHIHDNVFDQIGNVSESNTHAGIEIEGETIDINIHDNIIHSFAENGISIKSGLNRIRVNNNNIYNVGTKTSNTYDGIWIVAANTKTTDLVECKNNWIVDDRGGSAVMRDGVRIETVGTGVITNLIVEKNYVLGQLGSKINYVGTGHSFLRNKGVFQINGAVSTVNIPHKLSSTPTYYIVRATSIDAVGDFSYTVDSTNITITYPYTTPGGTNNLSYVWEAEVQ